MDINSLKFEPKICRTCLIEFSDSSQVIHLDSTESLTGSKTFREKLSVFAPELNTYSNFSSFICVDCAAAVDFVSAFKKKCLESEQKIATRDLKKHKSAKTQQESLEILNVYSLSENSEDGSFDKASNGFVESNSSKRSITTRMMPVKEGIVIKKEKIEKNPLEDLQTYDYTLFETFDIEFNRKVVLCKCNLCAYNSTLKIILDYHTKKHLKERTHWCQECIMNKSLGNQLINHMRSHKKKFKNYISTAFISRITVYQKQKNRETLFSCVNCEFITNQVSELKVHIKKH